MPDLITRRRLLVFLFAIFFVILSVLFFGRAIPSYSRRTPLKLEEEQQVSECYLTESIDVIGICEKCTSYQRRSKANGCLPTGYRELVLCTKSNIKTNRSCQMPVYIQKQHFWLFEVMMIIVGLVAIFSAQSRQKILDKQMVEKIKKQIGESDE
ncbi:unnamed protein product [Adineta steineri]|uniref:Protein JTB n=2 Tax=Adineta steineri TaxID=433720 RepID=A0A819D738_9BILA|nr:unnamed protein product [Adineta steineri]